MWQVLQVFLDSSKYINVVSNVGKCTVAEHSPDRNG